MSTKVTTVLDLYQYREFHLLHNPKLALKVGDVVVYKDSEMNDEIATIKYVENSVKEDSDILASSKVLRPASLNDIQKYDSNTERAKEAVKECKQLIKKHKLDMQVFQANYSFDGSRLLFLFTADERVDFRDLVKDLARIFQKQIYLRQIGPRDKAKLVGGYGKCGRELCCNKFLSKLESITMDMVRLQGLESKGSAKLSGVCGKLLCCLRYEVDAYKSLKSELPNISSIVKLKASFHAPAATAKVVGLDVLNQKLKLYFKESEEYITVSIKDIDKIIKK